jgi:hypothetical protein
LWFQGLSKKKTTGSVSQIPHCYVYFGVNLDIAVHQLRQFLAQRQSQSGTTTLTKSEFGLRVWLKNVLHLFFVNTLKKANEEEIIHKQQNRNRASVLDLEDEIAPMGIMRCACVQIDISHCREFDGIGDEIGEDLQETFLVRHDVRWDIRIDIERELNTARSNLSNV